MVGALLGSTVLMGHTLQLGNLDLWLLLGMAGLGWLLVGTALCLYDPRFSDRAPLDDLALVSITVVSITGMLYLERLLIAGGYPVVALTLLPAAALGERGGAAALRVPAAGGARGAASTRR